jgi:hypothetical protein
MPFIRAKRAPPRGFPGAKRRSHSARSGSADIDGRVGRRLVFSCSRMSPLRRQFEAVDGQVLAAREHSCCDAPQGERKENSGSAHVTRVAHRRPSSARSLQRPLATIPGPR